MKPAAMPRSAYRYARRHTTRWTDNDVYGHVNNALYYGFFDTTITAYLIENGFGTLECGPLFFVAASDCDYFSAFAFPEDIESGLVVAEVGRSSVTWRIGLFGVDEDAPRAQGRFVHVCVDRATRRPTAWPQECLDAFEAIRLG